MATNNPLAGVYNGGAVIFNTQPLAAMYHQYTMQRMAKQDALDNYFRDLSKNITPTGMRSQDIGALTQKTNEWQQFYQQNKQNILNPRNDSGKAYGEYMGRYQDMLGHIQQSKDALKTTDELNKTRLNPQTSYIMDDPNIIDKIHKHDLPIGHPDREEINIASLAVPPKPWDIKDQELYSKYLTQGLQMSETPGQTKFLPGFKTETPINKQYSYENLKVVGQRAMAAYDTDRSLQARTNQLAKQVYNNPGEQQKLNSIFHKYYGKDIENPKELLAAQSILDEDRKTIDFKQGEDTFGREKAMEAIRFGHAKQLKKGEQEAADGWIENFWNNRITDAKSGQPSTIPDPNNPLQMKVAYEIKPDAVMMKGLARNGQEPERVYVTVDNKIMPVFYEYKDDLDANGKKIGTSVKTDDSGNPVMDKDYSKPMDLDQAYLSLGYRGQTKKQLQGTMEGTYSGTKEKYPLPAGQPRTVKQNGHVYTWDTSSGEYK